MIQQIYSDTNPTEMTSKGTYEEKMQYVSNTGKIQMFTNSRMEIHTVIHSNGNKLLLYLIHSMLTKKNPETKENI
jgi:hypothetical protein